MATTIDAANTAKNIVELVGGQENVQSVQHCMTRLRFTLKDQNKANTEELKKIKGVMGVIVAGGQTQVVLGENLLPVYEAVLKEYKFSEESAIEENFDEKEKVKGIKGIGSAILGYVNASITPVIPAFVAGGMLKVVLTLINLANPAFSGSQTYMFLNWIGNSAYYFLPIFVAYGAAKKLRATPAYAMIVTAALLTPAWSGVIAAGEPVGFFGVPVRLLDYSSTLLPALLISYVAAYCEKLFDKVIPGILKPLLIGLLTIVVTGFLGFTILGPLGTFIGSIVVKAFMVLEGVAPIAVGVLTGCLPWLVMTGMHIAFGPLMINNLNDLGYDAIIKPALFLHNMAEGAACLGVGLKAKDKEFKSQAFSIAFGCFVAGVTEPAIYGINLKLRKPMYAVMAGGAIGGVVAGLFGAKAFTMGNSTIMSLPIYGETMLAMLAGVIVTIVVSAALAYILGFDQDEARV